MREEHTTLATAYYRYANKEKQSYESFQRKWKHLHWMLTPVEMRIIEECEKKRITHLRACMLQMAETILHFYETGRRIEEDRHFAKFLFNKMSCNMRHHYWQFYNWLVNLKAEDLDSLSTPELIAAQYNRLNKEKKIPKRRRLEISEKHWEDLPCKVDPDPKLLAA